MTNSLNPRPKIYRPRLTARQVELILETIDTHLSNTSSNQEEITFLKRELQLFYGRIELSMSLGLSGRIRDSAALVKTESLPLDIKAKLEQASLLKEFSSPEQYQSYIKEHNLEKYIST